MQVLIRPIILRFMRPVNSVLCLIISRHDSKMLLPKGRSQMGVTKDKQPDGCPTGRVSAKGEKPMPVDAQSILETIYRFTALPIRHELEMQCWLL